MPNIKKCLILLQVIIYARKHENFFFYIFIYTQGVSLKMKQAPFRIFILIFEKTLDISILFSRGQFLHIFNPAPSTL